MPAADQLAISYVPTNSLRPYERNPRTHSAEQVRQIAAAITEFGWTNPILVDDAGTIMAGHGRWAAAQQLGLAQVPVVNLGSMTDAQRRAYVIADNKLALNSGWDSNLLADEIGALRLDGFDLNLLGFSDGDMLRIQDDVDERMFARIAESEAAKPIIPAAEPRSGFAPRARAPEPVAVLPPEPAEDVSPGQAGGPAQDGLEADEDDALPPEAYPSSPAPQVAAQQPVSAPPQLVPVSVMVPPALRDTILAAVRHAKERDGIETTGEALGVIAREWLAEQS